MSTPTFFLTELDPQLRIKGSRDPLGFMSIWTRFGREVVGNLTTVTLSVRSFSTLLLGLDLIDELIESRKADEKERLNMFIRFEQLAAYSRVACRPEDREALVGVDGEAIRGIEKVKRGIEAKRPVRISSKAEDQILASQRIYGIWGLFTVAARESGLLERDQNRLTPAAREFVEQEYMGGRRHGGLWVEKTRRYLLKEGAFAPQGEHRELAGELANRLKPELSAAERKFYGEALVLGRGFGDRALGDRQERLWRALEETNGHRKDDWRREFGLAELEAVWNARQQAGDEDLAHRLGEIATLEPVLVAIASIFRYLLQCSRQRVERVVREIESSWGAEGLSHLKPARLEPMRGRIGSVVEPDGGGRLIEAAEALSNGDYRTVVQKAIEQNEAVMKGRSGAPWIRVERGIVEVFERERERPLPSRQELRQRWENTYFLNSLKTVGAKVYGKGAA